MEGKKKVPIKEGLFTSPLDPVDSVRLAGSKCRSCGEVFFGKRSSCENCSGESMEDLPLSQRGTLWSYTVIRHQPPAGYKGPDPFVPYGLGLVELPEGIRILSPIDCDLNKIKIGMELKSEVYKLYENEEGNEVMAFRFKPV
jgi:uncharacterized OB-fold protein